MALVGGTLLRCHVQIGQFLARLLQSGHGGVLAYVLVLQVVHPLLNGCLRHVVELVDANQEVLREDAFRRAHPDDVVLARVHL